MKKIIYSTIIALIIPFLSPCQNWQGLGTGMNGYVYCLYTDTITNTLYAGGQFTIAGGITSSGIAKWNGTAWDSIGNGLQCYPLGDIIRYKNEIYVTGGSGEGIYKWNGSSWVNVGGGLHVIGGGNGYGGRFFIYNNELYVGGAFDSVGNVYANSLAKWNDTVWTDVHALPAYDITQNGINSFIMYQGEMYAAGAFDGIGNDIVKWDGTSWQTVGGGILGIIDGAWITDMAIYNNELYVAGSFTRYGGNVGNFIQKWNGTNWSDVGGGMAVIGNPQYGDRITKLIVFHNKLYAMGRFWYAGGIPANFIASWDGTNWCSLGSTFGSLIYASAVYNDSLYIGGSFVTIDGNTLYRTAKWTGGNYTDGCGHINVGVNEIGNNEEISIYPNPATNEITIEIKEKGSISIYNVLGKMIIETKEKKIDVSGFAKGIYFIEVTTAKGIERKKFVKE